MLPNLSFGAPTNTTQDAKNDWFMRSLRRIEQYSRTLIDVTDLALTAGERTKLFGDTLFFVGATPVTATMTIATPAVITVANHGLTAGMGVRFSTTGALPTGITRGLLYFVLATGLTANTFQISLTAGGTAIATSGTQSGVHSMVAGSDFNTGAAATPAGAWATLQHAWDWICDNIDLNGCTAIIQFADGWYDFNNGNPQPLGDLSNNIWGGAYVQLIATPTGEGYIKLQGNTGDKTKVVLTTTAAIWATIEVDAVAASIIFDYLTLRSDLPGAWGTIIGAYSIGGYHQFWHVDFQGVGGWAHVDIGDPCVVGFAANYSITMAGETWNCHVANGGGGYTWWNGHTGPTVTTGPQTVTLQGTSANLGATGFLYAGSNSYFSFPNTSTAPNGGLVFSGTCTGTRFYYELGAFVNSYSGRLLNSLPGNAAGIILSGAMVATNLGQVIAGAAQMQITNETPGAEATTLHWNVLKAGAAVDTMQLSGALLAIGTTTNPVGLYINTGGNPVDSGSAAGFQLAGTVNFARTQILYLGADTDDADMTMLKTRATTVGARATVLTGDHLGNFICKGDDGTNFVSSGQIKCVAEGTVSTGIIPGRWEFKVANAAGTLARRAMLTSDGYFHVLTDETAANCFAHIGQMTDGHQYCGIRFSTTATDTLSSTTYSLLGNGTDTFINALTGGTVWFRINNATQASITANGMTVGSPTGGNIGAGKINVSAGVSLNNAAYTNPDYALEHWATGKIEKFAKNPGAEKYRGIVPLDALDDVLRTNFRLPGITDDSGRCVFERSDIALEKLEEAYIYIIQLHKRVQHLEAQACIR